MSLEMSSNPNFTPSGGMSFVGPGAANFMRLPCSNDGPNLPPRNDPNLSQQNAYERCDSYTCMTGGATDFMAQPGPPQYEASKSNNKGSGFYDKLTARNNDQPQDEYVSAAVTKFQLPPEDNKKEKEKEDVTQRPDNPDQEGDVKDTP